MSLCKNCKGSGQYLYPNTAKWDKRPGIISGQAMTWGECNQCWGSGDELAPGPNLLNEKIRKEIERGA